MAISPEPTEPQPNLTSEHLLDALDHVADYPRMAVEAAVAEERERILAIVQPVKSGRSHNVWWFRAIVKGASR